MATKKNVKIQTNLFGEEDPVLTLPVLLMDDINDVPDYKQLVDYCDNLYSKNDLVSICEHLKKVYSKYDVRNRKNPTKHIKAVDILFSVRKLKKDYSISVANIVCMKDNFVQYLSLLDGVTQQVWGLLFLYIYLSPERINKMVGLNLYDKSNYSYYSKYTTKFEALSWFTVGVGYYYNSPTCVSMPENLWKLYKDNVAVPQLQKLIVEQGIFDTLPQDNNLVIYDNEKEIGSQTNVIQELQRQGKLVLGTYKMGINDIKRANRQIQLPEFFPSTNTPLASSLAIPFLVNYFQHGEKDVVQYWDLLSDAFTKARFGFIIMDFFSHVKGLRRNDIIYNSTYIDIYEILCKILASLSLGKWYSVTNVMQRILASDDATMDDIKFLPLYIFEDVSLYDANDNRKRLGRDDFQDYFYCPLLQGFMALFAACGLVKIAYHDDGQGKQVGKYSFMEFVQLTRLGAFVFGKTDKYESEGIHMPQEYFSADENYLIILSKEIDGRNPYEGLMMSIAEPIGAHRYIVTPKTFMKGCVSADDLLKKEKFFNENICANPSAVWQEFFSKMLKRCNPLNDVNTTYLPKSISPDNRELQHLFLVDEYLRKHTLRAENHIILIEAKYIQKVKDVLRSYGYLIV